MVARVSKTSLIPFFGNSVSAAIFSINCDFVICVAIGILPVIRVQHNRRSRRAYQARSGGDERAHRGPAVGLMSYGVDFAWLMRRGASFVAKILRGAKSADLPVEQP